MAAGAITRTFPIKGLADKGIGLKTIEEAVALRNKVLERIEPASTMTDPAVRAKALTFVVVGGGFAGIECITEMEDLARAAVRTTRASSRRKSASSWSKPWAASCPRSPPSRPNGLWSTSAAAASKCC
jgi:NADH dehydrogenase FAD-containing subunit